MPDTPNSNSHPGGSSGIRRWSEGQSSFERRNSGRRRWADVPSDNDTSQEANTQPRASVHMTDSASALLDMQLQNIVDEGYQVLGHSDDEQLDEPSNQELSAEQIVSETSDIPRSGNEVFSEYAHGCNTDHPDSQSPQTPVDGEIIHRSDSQETNEMPEINNRHENQEQMLRDSMEDFLLGQLFSPLQTISDTTNEDDLQTPASERTSSGTVVDMLSELVSSTTVSVSSNVAESNSENARRSIERGIDRIKELFSNTTPTGIVDVLSLQSVQENNILQPPPLPPKPNTTGRQQPPTVASHPGVNSPPAGNGFQLYGPHPFQILHFGNQMVNNQTSSGSNVRPQVPFHLPAPAPSSNATTPNSSSIMFPGPTYFKNKEEERLRNEINSLITQKNNLADQIKKYEEQIKAKNKMCKTLRKKNKLLEGERVKFYQTISVLEGFQGRMKEIKENYLTMRERYLQKERENISLEKLNINLREECCQLMSQLSEKQKCLSDIQGAKGPNILNTIKPLMKDISTQTEDSCINDFDVSNLLHHHTRRQTVPFEFPRRGTIPVDLPRRGTLITNKNNVRFQLADLVTTNELVDPDEEDGLPVLVRLSHPCPQYKLHALIDDSEDTTGVDGCYRPKNFRKSIAIQNDMHEANKNVTDPWFRRRSSASKYLHMDHIQGFGLEDEEVERIKHEIEEKCSNYPDDENSEGGVSEEKPIDNTTVSVSNITTEVVRPNRCCCS